MWTRQKWVLSLHSGALQPSAKSHLLSLPGTHSHWKTM